MSNLAFDDRPLSLKHYDVLGIPVAATSLDRTVAMLRIWSQDRLGRFVGVRDVASLMACISDSDLLSLHSEAALVVPDGMPLVWIGKLRGFDVSRTSGPDLMEATMAASVELGLKHYFYGGKDGVAERLAASFLERFPGLKIVGYETPPFRAATDEENSQTITRISESGADIVWVGMSSPKQDVWMRDNYRKLSQTLIGVGAAFDFHSGQVARAPVWMRVAGLEWLFRLLSEPKRLWRRYLILAPKFIWMVSVDAIRTSINRGASVKK